MNTREHAVLSLFYDEGNRELTPSFLAYRMRISTADATALLDGMVKSGTLDLHFDDEGHISYRLPPSEHLRLDRRRRQSNGDGQSPFRSSAPGQSSPPLRERQPAGTDATAGYARATSTGSIDSARSVQDGTDGCLARPLGVDDWSYATATAHDETPPAEDQIYRDWYDTGDQQRPSGAGAAPNRHSQMDSRRSDPMAAPSTLTPYQSRHHLAPNDYYRHPGQRIPVLAGALSLLLPGLGQFYNGEFVKGVMLPLCCLFLMVFGLFWIVWIWSVIDAYMVAEQHNHRLLSPESHSPNPPLLGEQDPRGSNPNSNAA